MLFGEIVREAGLSPVDFPKLSQLPVQLFDRKNRLVEGSTIHFIEPLFERNNTAKSKFAQLLKSWEDLTLSDIQAKIDENLVSVWHGSSFPHNFSRLPLVLDPLDYMD